MTTWYSYYRNFSPHSSAQSTGLTGGYEINQLLNAPIENTSSDVKTQQQARILKNLQSIASYMLLSAGNTELDTKILGNALELYKDFLKNQISTSVGDERQQMIVNWQQYNSNPLIKQFPEYTALALAMLYIADGWRILGGIQNNRKYRTFIRTYLRRRTKDDPVKIAYTAVAKIMHNPLNAGDVVLNWIEESRDKNLKRAQWGDVFAPRLFKVGLPKLKQSEYYSLDEAAENPKLAGEKRLEVKSEMMSE